MTRMVVPAITTRSTMRETGWQNHTDGAQIAQGQISADALHVVCDRPQHIPAADATRHVRVVVVLGILYRHG